MFGKAVKKKITENPQLFHRKRPGKDLQIKYIGTAVFTFLGKFTRIHSMVLQKWV